MSRVVFLLEEASMKILLEGLLPRLFPDLKFLCIAHEGKNDLEKSIPRKLNAWNEPDVRFVVVRDNDNGDCLRIKDRLRALCTSAGRTETLVRIVCQELEAWYLGAPEALAQAYRQPKLANLAEKAKYREPDKLPKPSADLEKLLPEFQKLDCARRMGEILSESDHRSPSFRAFLSGLRRITA